MHLPAGSLDNLTCTVTTLLAAGATGYAVKQARASAGAKCIRRRTMGSPGSVAAQPAGRHSQALVEKAKDPVGANTE